MNGNYGFVEFYSNEKVNQRLSEASKQRLVPGSTKGNTILGYVLSLAGVVVAAALIF